MKRTDKLTLSHATNAFSNLVGTESSGTGKNISTRRGVGNPSNPHRANTVDGFEFLTMVKHELDGVAYWTPTYKTENA